VTEMVTGVDLVREQLRIAAGEKLTLAQADVTWRGWAIECRVNAEDPFAGWLPSPGTLTDCAPERPWVRDDSGASEGYTVRAGCDTLISKLIVWEPTARRVRRMARALRVTAWSACAPRSRRCARRRPSRLPRGRLSTGLLERVLPEVRRHDGRLLTVAVIAAVWRSNERGRRAAASAGGHRASRGARLASADGCAREVRRDRHDESRWWTRRHRRPLPRGAGDDSGRWTRASPPRASIPC